MKPAARSPPTRSGSIKVDIGVSPTNALQMQRTVALDSDSDDQTSNGCGPTGKARKLATKAVTKSKVGSATRQPKKIVETLDRDES